jgi:hypothetical protein
VVDAARLGAQADDLDLVSLPVVDEDHPGARHGPDGYAEGPRLPLGGEAGPHLELEHVAALFREDEHVAALLQAQRGGLVVQPRARHRHVDQPQRNALGLPGLLEDLVAGGHGDLLALELRSVLRRREGGGALARLGIGELAQTVVLVRGQEDPLDGVHLVEGVGDEDLVLGLGEDREQQDRGRGARALLPGPAHGPLHRPEELRQAQEECQEEGEQDGCGRAPREVRRQEGEAGEVKREDRESGRRKDPEDREAARRQGEQPRQGAEHDPEVVAPQKDLRARVGERHGAGRREGVELVEVVRFQELHV